MDSGVRRNDGSSVQTVRNDAYSVLSVLRVFARQLRRLPFLLLVLPVEARFAAPRALELVLHVELEPSQLFRFDFDDVTVHECAKSAMVGSRPEDVPGFDRMDRAHPFDAARNLVRHVA